MADVSKVNVNSTDYNIKDSNAMHKGVDYVTAGKKSGTTLGNQATAEGSNTTASGLSCHAEGNHTTASDSNTHAEGSYTTASKTNAHAEGSQTTASGAQAHSEGLSTTASGDYSHSEGLSTTASGNAAHTEGSLTEAAGGHGHAEGMGTKASSHDQHVEGMYNVEDTNGTYAHIIGGGTSNNARKNIFTVDWNGVARDGTENRLLPFKAVSEAEYAALSQAEKTNGTAYFRYEANGIMREIQDNGSATSLTSGALPTGQTIKSYLNSNLGTVYRSDIIDFKNLGNDSSVTASITIPLIKVGIIIYTVSHCGSNKSAGGFWEVAGLNSPYARAAHAIPIPGHWDDTVTMTDLLVNIAAGTYTLTFVNKTGVATDITYNSRVYATVIKIQ